MLVDDDNVISYNENDDKIKRENKSESKSVRKDNIENIVCRNVRGRLCAATPDSVISN